MELWIRSQDRLRLAKMDSVIINVRNKKEITSNYSYTSDGFEKDIPLGEYNSEERALEVLDEIQRLITDLQYMSYAVDSSSFYSYRPNVYEMPKE